MTISTFAAGLVIVAGTALLKLLEKEDEIKKRRIRELVKGWLINIGYSFLFEDYWSEIRREKCSFSYGTILKEETI